MNAGAALVVSGKAQDMNEGIQMAGVSIDSGKAREVLVKVIKLTSAGGSP